MGERVGCASAFCSGMVHKMLLALKGKKRALLGGGEGRKGSCGNENQKRTPESDHESHMKRFFSSTFITHTHTDWMSHVTCHMSHVTCHMSHVTCHMSQTNRQQFRTTHAHKDSTAPHTSARHHHVCLTGCTCVCRCRQRCTERQVPARDRGV